MTSDPSVSMVIPTRNRPDHVVTLLGATSRQTRPPNEVIIIDASDEPRSAAELARRFPDLPITVEPHYPSVCAQRNRGIALAAGDWVFLCDDDIDPPTDYIRGLLDHAALHPDEGAITGLVRQPGAAAGPRGLRIPRATEVLVAFLQQTSIWADEGLMRSNGLLAPIRAWYRRRGNTWTLAGWPLMTQVEDDMIRTTVYHLGAALVRREWLVSSPYDLLLDAHGMGDHYGVALGFPADLPITILTTLSVRHRRAEGNRIAELEGKYKRTLALHYFMRRSSKFSLWNEAWLLWSLSLQALFSALRGRFRLAWMSTRAAGAILTGRNRLLRE
ncbi:MAG: glycosyltransferase family A protein [Gammaproteobacteria bacterium]|nr:glycosyltransferase family A protein [Gammaproteobacteria bacterium]